MQLVARVEDERRVEVFVGRVVVDEVLVEGYIIEPKDVAVASRSCDSDIDVTVALDWDLLLPSL